MTTGVVPAGPKGHLVMGILPDYRRDPLNLLLRSARDYGDIVPLRFGTTTTYLISHPDAIEQVLVADHRRFHKGLALQRSRVLFGNGLLTSEGDFWRRQRRLAQPAFHRERIAAYGQTMVDQTLRHIAAWSVGQTRDIHEEMMRITLQIAVKTLFGAEITEMSQAAQALGAAQETFARYIPYVVMLPSWLPTPTTPRLAHAIRQLDAIVYRLIRERRAGGEDRGDLLSMLLRAQDEGDGVSMTDRQLRDEVLTLLLAGHDTTALTLTWTLFLLSRSPEVEARLQAELDAVLNGRAPAVEDRAQLKYTERVIQEAMRLYPPAYALGRMAVEDYEINGFFVPSGKTLLMSQWVVHRDPRWFPDPERFDPDRWTDSFIKMLPRYAYFPFGGGPRVCIGQAFAMTEAVLLLATLAQRFRFRTASDQRIELDPAVTLRPKHGLRMALLTPEDARN